MLTRPFFNSEGGEFMFFFCSQDSYLLCCTAFSVLGSRARWWQLEQRRALRCALYELN